MRDTKRWMDVAAAVVTVVLGAGISWSLERAAVEREQRDGLIAWSRQAQQHGRALQGRLDRDLTNLASLAAAIDTFGPPTRTQFHTFTAGLLADSRGVQALAWIPHVAIADRDAFERQATVDHGRPMVIRALGPRGTLMPAAGPSSYFPVAFVEPIDGNEEALSFDLGSCDERFRTLALARDRGQPMASARVSLVQRADAEPEAAAGILVFHPLYEGGTVPTTVAERRDRLLGFALGVFALESLVADIVAPTGADPPALTIHDLGAPAADRVLYRSDLDPNPDPAFDGPVVSHLVHLPGRAWRIEIRPRSATHPAIRSPSSPGVLVSGIVASCLFAGLVLSWRRGQAALAISEGRLRQIIDLVPHGIFARDARGRYLLANQAVADAFGTTTDALVHRTHRTVHSEAEEAEALLAQDRTVIARGEPLFIPEERLTDCRGVEHIVQTTKIPFTASGANTPAVLGVTVDITQRTRTERALFEEKERALVTLASIADGVISTDGDGRISFLNPVAESLTGWSAEEASGRPLSEVLTLVDEKTRQGVSPRAVAAPTDGLPRPDDTLLISRRGRERAVRSTAAPIRDSRQQIAGMVLVLSDVTETRVLSRQMAYQARHDPLTGLLNRRALEHELVLAVDQARETTREHALCFLDLDRFKIVNDTAGHAAGDALLQQVAAILRARIRTDDTLARLGGDEFCLLLTDCPLAQAMDRAELLVADLAALTFSWGERTFRIGASVGVAPITATTASAAEALSVADTACYAAKDEGRNRVHTVPTSETPARSDLTDAMELTDALREGRLRLYRQPIVPLDPDAARTHRRYELLLRLVDREGAIETPGGRIAAAERYGLMVDIDRWVVRRALERLATSPPGDSDIEVSINLSGSSVAQPTMLDFVHQRILDSGIDPRRLCFEITETAAITHLGDAVRFMRSLRRLGCRFALDDFGSGLASFRYLKNLPVDYLKIDGYFVRHLVESRIDQAMVAAINQMGRSLGIETVAEWVEGDAEVAALRAIGVDHGQGYAFGRPLPFEGTADDDVGLATRPPGLGTTPTAH